MAIHIGIFPRRWHISDSLWHGIFEFRPLSYWWIKITDFLKSVHSLEPVPILSFLTLNSPFLKRFYIIIDNYINELKILIILSIFRLEICGPSSILSYCNINTLRGKNGQDCRTFWDAVWGVNWNHCNFKKRHRFRHSNGGWRWSQAWGRFLW